MNDRSHGASSGGLLALLVGWVINPDAGGSAALATTVNRRRGGEAVALGVKDHR
jgi:hypothetical protein